MQFFRSILEVMGASPIHRRSEVKGAVTSTRRLMKIAGLGLFIVIFVFVARTIFFGGKLQIFFGIFGFWEYSKRMSTTVIRGGCFFCCHKAWSRGTTAIISVMT